MMGRLDSVLLHTDVENKLNEFLQHPFLQRIRRQQASIIDYYLYITFVRSLYVFLYQHIVKIQMVDEINPKVDSFQNSGMRDLLDNIHSALKKYLTDYRYSEVSTTLPMLDSYQFELSKLNKPTQSNLRELYLTALTLDCLIEKIPMADVLNQLAGFGVLNSSQINSLLHDSPVTNWPWLWLNDADIKNADFDCLSFAIHSLMDIVTELDDVSKQFKSPKKSLCPSMSQIFGVFKQVNAASILRASAAVVVGVGAIAEAIEKVNAYKK